MAAFQWSHGATSGGVAGLTMLPHFALPSAEGGFVRSRDFKGRRHVVLWFAGSAPPLAALRRAALERPRFDAEDATLLVIVRASPEEAQGLVQRVGAAVTILVDEDGVYHARVGAAKPIMLVVDRDGVVYWGAPVAGETPAFDEARGWLEYLNVLEPECGSCVPAWPVDLTAWPPGADQTSAATHPPQHGIQG